MVPLKLPGTHGRAGSPVNDDVHFPDHREKGPGDYLIKACSTAEAEFLRLGAGAHQVAKLHVTPGTQCQGLQRSVAVAQRGEQQPRSGRRIRSEAQRPHPRRRGRLPSGVPKRETFVISVSVNNLDGIQ